jgi:hypothetical protein
MGSFKVVLARSDMLTIKLGLTDLTPNPDLTSGKLTYQIYPAHVEIRKNMTPSTWKDLLDLISSINVLTTDDQDQLKWDSFMELWN